MLQSHDFRIDFYATGSSENGIHLINFRLYLLLLEDDVLVIFLFQIGFIDFIFHILPEEFKSFLGAR